MAENEWHSETRAIRAGRTYNDSSLAPVLWPSTTYFNRSVDENLAAARSSHPSKFYSRNGSPTVLEFEDAIADLEGAEAALAFGSGMGALSSVLLTFCGAGDHVVAQSRTFSVTNQMFTMLCPRLGIDVTFVDATDADAVRVAVRPGKTQLVIVESPANPGLDVVDLDAIGSIAGPFTVCDATFAPPPVQQTLSHGIDLVMHAATKGIAGHNDAMLGAIAGERDLIAAVWAHHLMHGAVCSPFDAWNALRGIRTLHARIRQQSETAQALAEFLEGHPAVSRVAYPGLDSHPQRDVAKRQMTSGGTVLTFELADGLDAGRSFVEGVELAQVAPSLGGPETLVVHPPTMTAATLTPAERAAMGIGEGMIRVSVGLEHADDVLDDFGQSLDRAG
ncbi:MAG TPA: aminotransferase class I/II-fold pyridoxal phosphate-dependent enzyme [Acidimicrobiales bacterium]|jgi:cystathionine beta-lyase/cystathionine gamma-synthase|nr:aminotransferase class I/II-fold pyridoxal phosphate-dependent enzyme [Acidimicrobiales bacterium]